MFADFIQKIETQHAANLPFVAFRKPNESTVKALFQKDAELLEVKTFTEEGFVFTPFSATSPSVLLRMDEVLEVDYDRSFTYKSNNGLFEDATEEEKATHIQVVERAIREIDAGTFHKVVVSRKLEVACAAHPVALFLRLLETYRTAYCYLWYHPKVGLWLGATPERLLKIENERLSTTSLAGTQPYKANTKQVWGHKEIEEQQLVTDYIVEALKNSVSDMSVSKAQTVRAGELLHLKTTITGVMENTSTSQILHQLHPTPAVCGMPKTAAKTFILEHENYDREYYTGFLGELNRSLKKERVTTRKNIEHSAYRSIKKATELFVNLRCVQLNNNKATIYVGGGVTKDSIALEEWEETVHKSRTMLQVIV